MHSTGVVVTSLIVAAASVIGIGVSDRVSIALLAVAVAIIGVPHGGLDHWTGRQLLSGRYPRGWLPIFLFGYLSVSLLMILCWFIAPAIAVLVFFLASAWHFGMEDQSASPTRARSSRTLLSHLKLIGVGGLVIWVPVLAKPDQIGSIFTAIFGGDEKLAQATVHFVLPVAAVFAAIGLWTVASRLQGDDWKSGVRDVAFVTLFLTADVLVSFGIYFCGWHSVRGLKRLAAEHGLSASRLATHAAPLSIATLALFTGAFVYVTQVQPISAATMRVLFIGLSAVAMPHLLLHSLPAIRRKVVGDQPTELRSRWEVSS